MKKRIKPQAEKDRDAARRRTNRQKTKMKMADYKRVMRNWPVPA